MSTSIELLITMPECGCEVTLGATVEEASDAISNSPFETLGYIESVDMPDQCPRCMRELNEADKGRIFARVNAAYEISQHE